jgi:hypothetical protein
MLLSFVFNNLSRSSEAALMGRRCHGGGLLQNGRAGGTGTEKSGSDAAARKCRSRRRDYLC